LNYARELAGAGVSRAELEKIDAEVSKEADAAARFALESPLPEAKEAIKYAFAGRGN
jgi:TPP-dependent pyruvate/acetoin dehydrogenase alpha subunit